MLTRISNLITPLDQAAIEECQLRLDNLTKPLGSLHSFEHLACQIAGITGVARPRVLKKKKYCNNVRGPWYRFQRKK